MIIVVNAVNSMFAQSEFLMILNHIVIFQMGMGVVGWVLFLPYVLLKQIHINIAKPHSTRHKEEIVHL